MSQTSGRDDRQLSPAIVSWRPDYQPGSARGRLASRPAATIAALGRDVFSGIGSKRHLANGQFAKEAEIRGFRADAEIHVADSKNTIARRGASRQLRTLGERGYGLSDEAPAKFQHVYRPISLHRSIGLDAALGEGGRKAIPKNTLKEVRDISDNTPDPRNDLGWTITGLGLKHEKRIGTLTAANTGRRSPDRDRVIHSPQVVASWYQSESVVLLESDRRVIGARPSCYRNLSTGSESPDSLAFSGNAAAVTF